MLSKINQNPVIDLREVEFSYDAHKVLNIPQFSISKGEKVFLFGPSGSGKTSLLELISGLSLPQKGSVKILQQELTQMSEKQRDHFRGHQLSFIFQSFNLIPYLTIKENILLSRELFKKESKPELFEQLVEGLGLKFLIHKNVTELSIGQQQRVAAARALYSEPQLILADEPTSSLDYDHRHKFLKLLFELVSKIDSTLLFVSHDRSLQSEFDRAVALPEINKIVGVSQ